jgi:myxalamid-type polyketide synthase MxaD
MRTISSAKLALLTQKLHQEIEGTELLGSEPIAILGIGCRLPGAVETPEGYWQLLQDKVDAVGEMAEERWKQCYPELSSVRQWGGFLDQIDRFDPYFFGIPPREVVSMDPQHRLLLETTWEALERAGQRMEDVVSSKAGVFVAIYQNDYLWHLGQSASRSDRYLTSGNAHSLAVNRISYLLNAQGPSMAIDTACSSSLVSIHLACNSLRNRECDMALAGGVNLILTPLATDAFADWNVLSSDRLCKTFDAQADGMVRGEGCGMIVLKRFADALAAGDPIAAIIRGSAVNQDGRSNGFTVPNGHAQRSVIRQALKNALVDPSLVSYIETHGTGTALGDPIEVEALADIYGAASLSEQPCVLGATKTNIGHLEAAAGIAGLIKVVLSFQHEAIPANLHFQTLNPYISLENTRFVLPVEMRPWPAGEGPRYAAVSSFGMGGTNAHVILEEAPRRPARKQATPQTKQERPYLLPLSAQSPEALQGQVEAYLDFFHTEVAQAAPLDAICTTASLRRSHHLHRLAITGRSLPDMKEQLQLYMREGIHGKAGSRPERVEKVVFVFSGVGSQWAGMGCQLLEEEPVFRASIDACEAAFRPYVDWSLRQELEADEQHSRLNQVEIMQPALFAIQVALAALWRAWGIEPSTVVGHSMGEIAAAHIAGALSLADAAHVICVRGQLLKRVQGQGAMGLVQLSAEKMQQALKGYEGQVNIAARNSPQSLVISGETAAVEKILLDLQEQGIFCRKINADVAFHSPQMDALLADFTYQLSSIRPVKAGVGLFSTVTHTLCTGSELGAQYWAANLREPVLFDTAIQTLAQQGLTTFLELGPHPVLLQAIEGCVQHIGRSGTVLPSLSRKRQELESMLNTLGALYRGGYPVQWGKIYAQTDQYVALPTYCWQRERFWVDYQKHGNYNGDPRLPGSKKGQTLLGKSLSLAHDPQTHIWEGLLDIRELPIFKEHAIQGLAILPASGYIEMALEAASELFDRTPLSLRDISFEQMLALTEETREIQMVVAPQTRGAAQPTSFQLFSRQSQHTSSQDIWKSHVRGTLVPAVEQAAPLALSFEEFQHQSQVSIDGEHFYTALKDGGFYYGPAFQGVERIWLRPGEALARLRLTVAVLAEWELYRFHPGLLDACWQVVAATVTSTLEGEKAGNGSSAAYLPVRIGSISLHRLPDKQEQLWSYARLDNNFADVALLPGADLYIMNEDGQVLLEVHDLQFQSLDSEMAEVVPDTLNEALYRVKWQASPLELHGNEGAEEEKDGIADDSSWLIFANQDEFAVEIQASLEARGERYILVYPGDIYDRLNNSCYSLNPEDVDTFGQLLFDAYTAPSRACRGVLYLWSTLPETEERLSLEILAAAERIGCGSVLSLVQALSYADWIEMPRLWLVTRGTQSVDGQTSLLSLSQAPLWGLGRTLAYEHPEMYCTCIDVSMQMDQSERELFCAVLHTYPGEDQVVLRNGERYVARLAPYSANDASTSEQSRSVSLHADATYLITGGLGGLGLKVASWMIEQGARSLALLGRHAPAQEASAVIQSLEQKGAKILVFQGDVSVAKDVANVVEQLAAIAPPLRGIIHAAAVLDDGVITRLNQKRLQTVLAPKVEGAWNLHTYTKNTPLDFFILFSSLASLLGPPGQGNYAAANAFLDALAHFRRAQGLPATSINWCGWSEVGMAVAQTNSDERAALQGVASIAPDQGLDLLARFLQQAPVQVGILPMDFDRWQYILTQRRVSPMLEELIRAQASRHKTRRNHFNAESAIRQELLATSAQEERTQIMEAYLRQQMAEVLHIETHRVDPDESLNKLGLDSLMSLELKNRTETDLQVSLPIIAFIHGSSIKQLARDLLLEVIPVDAIGETQQGNQELPDESSTLLVVLQPRGKKRPFFCIHGAMGYVHGYDELAYCIDNERPFYGIQALGLDGREEPIADMHGVAARYVKAIRTVQPQGPYLLGGSSFGGVIALEMARQLEQQGEVVGFLALIDSILPVGTAISTVLQDEIQILTGAFKFICYFFNDEFKVTDEELRQVPSAERIDYLLTYGSVKNSWIASFGREQAYNFIRVFLSILEINKHYNPTPITQHVTFFRASERLPVHMMLPGFPDDDDLVQGWADYTQDPIEVYDVPGNHVTMNREPHVRVLANYMRICIERFENENVC